MKARIQNISSAIILSLVSVAGHAQLSGNVTVEGQYVPLVIETERLNTFPQGYKFELPAANVEYDFTGVITDFRPGLLSMGVTGRMTDWPWLKRRGFVDFRLGSWLDSRLHAGVAIIADNVQSLNAELKFLSSCLYRTKGVPDTYPTPSRKRLYDGELGLDYSRLLGKEGLLTADLRYRLGHFNYYGTAYPPAPYQTLNRINAKAGYSSSPSFIRGWHAEAAVDYFGYRSFYEIPGARLKGTRETMLNVDAGYNFAAGDNGAVAIDVDGDFIFFADKESAAIDPLRNYGVIDIKPSYRLENNGIRLQAGLDLTGTYDAMGNEVGKQFSHFHVAPDVNFSYTGKGFGLSLAATGGVTPVTLGLREKFDRYQLPVILSTQPIYSPIDASLGLSVGPFAGFQADLALRYAVAKNVPLGGWYQAYLGCYNYQIYPDYLNPYAQSINLHGFSANLGLHYSYGTLVALEFNGAYTPQNGKQGIFNGFDRPRWTLSAKAGVRPISKLNIELGYDYRGVRNCYGLTRSSDVLELDAVRLPDITDLNAKVTYSLLDNLDIYCKGENLINRHVDILPGLQSEGIVIQGGVYFEF